jgi:hypothetical protein
MLLAVKLISPAGLLMDPVTLQCVASDHDAVGHARQEQQQQQQGTFLLDAAVTAWAYPTAL